MTSNSWLDFNGDTDDDAETYKTEFLPPRKREI